MSLSKLLQDIFKEPAKPLISLPSCLNCYYVEGKLCKKRNMQIEYDRAKICPYYTQEQPTISMPISDTELQIATLRKVLGLEDSLSSLKSDIADMKATIGDLKGMKVLNVVEMKGGGTTVNEYSTDTEVYVTGVCGYTLKREFNINTPTPPSGVTVYKYALLVSYEQYSDGNTTPYIKILVDGEVLCDEIASGSYTWRDRSKEVSAGSHNVKIYLKHGTAGKKLYLRGTRAVCGIGTIGTADTKVISIEISGDGRLCFYVEGKSWGADVTLTGSGCFDDNLYDKKVGSVNVTKGGTAYGVSASYDGFCFTSSDFYGKTSNASVPIFYKWSHGIFRRVSD